MEISVYFCRVPVPERQKAVGLGVLGQEVVFYITSGSIGGEFYSISGSNYILSMMDQGGCSSALHLFDLLLICLLSRRWTSCAPLAPVM